MACHLLDPLRLNVGNAPAKQAGGLHQLGRHNPAARFFAELGTGVTVKLDAARAQVPVFFVVFLAKVAKQAAQHRQMQLLVAGGFGVHLPALLANRAVQLRMNVPPFTHAAHVDEIVSEQVFMLAVGQLVHRVVPAA